MDSYILDAMDSCFQCINAVGNWMIDVIGEFGFTVVLSLSIAFVVYRLLIKPITGYGVGSDSARPKKGEKGE